MQTGETTKGTSTKLTTSMADLGSVVRLNPNNFNPSSFSFVSNERLQLKEAPITNPIVQSLSSPLFSYAFEVFHDYLVSIKAGNNVFTNTMVCVSHIPLLFSREHLEMPSGAWSAFSLKNRTQVFELPFDLLYFIGIIKLAVGSDCQVVYSEI